MFLIFLTDSYFREWALSHTWICWPNYRKFLRLSFPWIGHLGICHSFMLPLIGAAKHCRSAFVELRSELNPWNTNPWLRPLISRNKESLTMKLESFILSIFKYARPDLRITDSDWCQEYFENHQFIGIHCIFEDNKDFYLTRTFMSVKVRVKLSSVAIDLAKFLSWAATSRSNYPSKKSLMGRY